MDIIVAFSLTGSVASVIALLLPASTWRLRLIHLVYGLAITTLAVGVVQYQNKLSAANKRIEEMQRIEKQATSILHSADRSTAGSMAGLILATLAFLEKHKDTLPDTYGRALEVAKQSGYMEKQSNGSELDHFARLQEASGAMEYLLRGLAAGEHP